MEMVVGVEGGNMRIDRMTMTGAVTSSYLSALIAQQQSELNLIEHI